MKNKAGGIPYMKVGEELFLCLFRSNNPYYGGPLLQISKGGIDEGEDILTAAKREIFEEMGICVNKWDKLVVKKSSTKKPYNLHVYTFPVKEMSKPAITDEGTGEWVSINKFYDLTRKDHAEIIKDLFDL